ncbi:MAG: methionine aminotransferase [Planctomycetota bacterium]
MVSHYPISEKLRPFGTTVFSEMTQLATQHSAINLAQGFPDFDGPPEIIEAASRALHSGENQYSRSLGHPELVEAIADGVTANYGLKYDPFQEVGVHAGATEAIAAALIGLLNPGDEVILFEPFYDSFPACVALAGAVPRYCTLRFPTFELDMDELARLFNPRTRLLLINTPHNPTGKVFTREELQSIAELCCRHDVGVLSDEVYEHITFAGAQHIPMATLEEMRERTLTISSSGKTYSFTGWKIGWVTGPKDMVAAAQAAHQFLTFCAATPLQIAIAAALRRFAAGYYTELRREYQERRDVMLTALTDSGFQPVAPLGTYFILADFHKLSQEDDRTFAHRLTKEGGVAAVPPSVFYKVNRQEGNRLLRFAFSKRVETLREAGRRLRAFCS